jgi:hypothetical protein
MFDSLDTILSMSMFQEPLSCDTHTERFVSIVLLRKTRIMKKSRKLEILSLFLTDTFFFSEVQGSSMNGSSMIRVMVGIRIACFFEERENEVFGFRYERHRDRKKRYGGQYIIFLFYLQNFFLFL